MMKRDCLQQGRSRILSPLGILTVTMTLMVPTRGQQSFSGMESYALYPGWNGLNVPESLLQITFRTSASDGLILYAEGLADDVLEALEIRLEGGRISMEVRRRVVVRQLGQFREYGPQSQQLYLSENLNDNAPHTLSLRRTSGQATLSVVDKSESVDSDLLGMPGSPIGSTGIYIGGVPTNVSSSFNSAVLAFAGCLEDIQFANNSSTMESLVTIMPLQLVGVTDGCMDPCANVLCGEGTCIPILPDRFFCDCSSTTMGGASCNEGMFCVCTNRDFLDAFVPRVAAK